MKKVFLLIVVPALLVAMGFAQTTVARGNTDQVKIQGCLGGSDGSYTVAEGDTGKIFKITSSSTDLKAYVGQDVNLTGHKGTAENSLAVTELNMISVHCAAAAAASPAVVSAPAEMVNTPSDAAAVAPVAVAPDASVSSPPETVIEGPTPAAPAATAPPATVSTPPETISTSPAAVAPVAAVSAPAETASAPSAVAAVPRTPKAARLPKPAAPPAAVPAPAEPVSTPVADANKISAPVGPLPETASTPAAPAPKPATRRSAWMVISIIVVVLLIGTAVPLYNRWRKRRLLELAEGQNLSFTHRASSDPGRSDRTGGSKAA